MSAQHCQSIDMRLSVAVFVATSFASVSLSIIATPHNGSGALDCRAHSQPIMIRSFITNDKEIFHHKTDRSLQSAECLDAYAKLHDDYPQFTAFFNDVFGSFLDCNCDTDGVQVTGSDRFNTLVAQCNTLDATSYVETIEFDCDGVNNDVVISNLFDCIPTVCTADDAQLLAANAENAFEVITSQLNCQVEYESSPTSGAFMPNAPANSEMQVWIFMGVALMGSWAFKII